MDWRRTRMVCLLDLAYLANACCVVLNLGYLVYAGGRWGLAVSMNPFI
jgi:hypothetical protein